MGDKMTQTIILGEIYDPDTDCYYILHRCPAEEWDKFKQQTEEMELPETDAPFGKSSRYVKT